MCNNVNSFNSLSNITNNNQQKAIRRNNMTENVMSKIFSREYIKTLEARQTGTVHFSTSPNGADIYIDGQIMINPETEESIKTPAKVILIEGRRDFSLHLRGHKTIEGYVDILPNVNVDIHRNFEVETGDLSQQTVPKYTLEKLKHDMGFLEIRESKFKML